MVGTSRPIALVAGPMQWAGCRPSRRRAQGHTCGYALSARRAGLGPSPHGAALAVRHTPRGFPASQPAPRQAPPTDTAPAASQTLLPPSHSSSSVPDLAPSHHTHLHQRCGRPFLRHEKASSGIKQAQSPPKSTTHANIRAPPLGRLFLPVIRRVVQLRCRARRLGRGRSRTSACIA
jgi:hypothetical protein